MASRTSGIARSLARATDTGQGRCVIVAGAVTLDAFDAGGTPKEPMP
jgi:hypothetical protein